MATSSVSSTLSSLSTKTGMSGLVSGMDTEEIIKNMTATARQRILKQQQNVQKLEWKQTGYRSVTSALKSFQSNYLDVLSKTNFRSTSFFNTVQANTSSTAVSVSANATAIAGKMVINKITQLATKQNVQSTVGVTADMKLSGLTGLSTEDAQAKAATLFNQSVSITLDGTVKTITFDEAFTNAIKSGDNAQISQEMQRLLDKAFGTYQDDGVTKSRITVDNNLQLTASGSQITVNAVGENGTFVEALGLKQGQSTKLTTFAEIERLNFATPLDDSETFKFTINGQAFEFGRGTTISKIISQVNNNTKAGVTLSYSSVSDKFTITSNAEGAGDNIQISQEQGNLLTSMGLLDESGDFYTGGKTDGVNAILEVNGQQIVRDSNTIEVDGVKITLKETSSSAIDIELKNDASSLKESIQKFVDDYNAMVSLASGLTAEKVYSDYAPLSDEQKAEMTETQIKDWEAKAKSGVLRADRILISLTSKLQSTLLGSNVNGFSLFSMGITTGGYGCDGNLKINETKLDEALANNADQVRDLFTDANGLGNKMNTLIDTYISTSGNKGQRGILIEAAGMESTRSETENSIYDSIKRTNKLIDTLQDRLESQEATLWKRFTAMETALEKLNSQSAILTQFSSNSNQ